MNVRAGLAGRWGAASLLVLGCSVISTVAGPARADEVVLTDGKTVRGRVVARDDASVTVQTLVGGMRANRRIKLDAVREVRIPERKGARYCTIPVRGIVGHDVTADGVRDALAQARADGVQVAVLLIDTDGGLVVDERGIVDAIRAHRRDLTVVAFVKTALSAGSAIALACPTVVVRADAQIGSRVMVDLSAPDRPVAVLNEKLLAVDRAYLRTVSEAGGHDPLWLRGMSEPDLVLAAHLPIPPPGAPVPRPSPAPTTAPTTVPTAGPTAAATPTTVPVMFPGSALYEATGAPGEVVIKKAGSILAVTGTEAVAYGLAVGTAVTLDDVRRHLDLDAWHQLDDAPAQLVAARAAARREQDRERFISERSAREAVALQAEIEVATARVAAAAKQFDQLVAVRDHDLRGLQAEYERARGRNDTAAMAQLERAAKDMLARYTQLILAAERDRDEMTALLIQLQRRQQDAIDRAKR